MPSPPVPTEPEGAVAAPELPLGEFLLSRTHFIQTSVNSPSSQLPNKLKIPPFIIIALPSDSRSNGLLHTGDCCNKLQRFLSGPLVLNKIRFTC